MITKDFITAGRAVFTVESKTGERYTYRVAHKEGDGNWPDAWFISLLTGPCNESDYTYLGMLDDATGKVRLTKASKYSDDTIPVKVIRWALGLLWAEQDLPPGYKIHHEGRCGRCGRTLTVPESIESGFGPECIKMLAV